MAAHGNVGRAVTAGAMGLRLALAPDMARVVAAARVRYYFASRAMPLKRRFR